MDYKTIAQEVFEAALESVKPHNALQNAISLEESRLLIEDRSYDLSAYENIYLFASGKAALPMAAYMEKLLGNRISGGVVVSNMEGTLASIPVIVGTHPVPSQKSIDGATKMVKKLQELGENDFYIYLLSGGNSALMELPMEPASLDDFQETTRLLLSSGAEIHEINSIRKHISQVKGGKLSTLNSASGVVLTISDVIGDHLDTIGSGPFYPDSTTYEDAWKIVNQYNLQEKLPESIRSIFTQGLAGKIPDTPKNENPKLTHHIISSNAIALHHADEKAKALGLQSHVICSDLQGEASDVARQLVADAESKKSDSPQCYLYGGETTVTLKGKGKGGRNQEMVLSALGAIQEREGIVFLSAGTDGIDGNSDAGGAVVDASSFQKAADLGISWQHYLDNNDSNTFFAQTGSLIKPGPTGTNVMDITLVITY